MTTKRLVLVLGTTALAVASMNCSAQAALRCDIDHPCRESGFWCDLAPPYPEEAGVCRPYLDAAVEPADAETADASPQPIETLTPVLDFSETLVGQAQQKTAIFKNVGDQDTSPLFATITGETSQYKIMNSCPSAPLRPLFSCSVTVSYVPTFSGSATATLWLRGSAGELARADMRGTGSSAPDFDVSPDTHDFGSVVVGSASVPLSVTIRNATNTPLPAFSLEWSSNTAWMPEWTTTPPLPCSSGIASGSSCTFELRFRPRSSGPKATSVKISHNAYGHIEFLDLTGRGTP